MRASTYVRSGAARIEIGLFALCGALVLGAGVASGADSAVKLGGKVTPFERKDSTGKAVKLTDVMKSSKAVVLDFWSSKCPVSKRYEPVMKKIASDYGPKGVAVLGIDSNYNEPAEEVESIRKERGVNFPVLMDGADGKLATYFAASHTPEVYVLSPDGVVMYHGNPDDAPQAIDAVLAGKLVPKPETRAFGCSIKRP